MWLRLVSSTATALLLIMPAHIAAASGNDPTQTSHHSYADEPIAADASLREQIDEVRHTLDGVDRQIQSHQSRLARTQDAGQRAALQRALRNLQKERNDFAAILRDLTNEAHISQHTDIDEALERARQRERHEEYEQRREEDTRDRQK